MAVELAAVWINPYTIKKSRTGGVIARLLSLSPCELVSARLFAPGAELVEKYTALISPKGSAESRDVRSHIRSYIREQWLKKDGAAEQPRVMVLLFKGENAVSILRTQVVGPITRDSILGETVRDTYGDFITDPQGRIRYFEPAVFIIPEAADAEATLKLWARYSDSDGGILEKACRFPADSKPETTLVLIKPENFKGPSSLAGNVIDLISRTGLKIIGAKVVHMSVEQAQEFYRPVLERLPDRFKGRLQEDLKQRLADVLDFAVSDDIYADMADRLKGFKGESEFRNIVRTMTGLDPAVVTTAQGRKVPGPETCLALIYRGDKAIARIRSVLGATDPHQAEWATIRRIYGHTINENVAHASDSRPNAQREIKIIRMGENDFKQAINEFYRS
jgi:nucleoside diphosphate kinase